MKTKFFVLAALLAGFTWQAVAADDIAVVNDNKVNVRGQATVNSEVITQLKKGEKVAILEEITVAKPKKGEPAKWYRIALPANTPVWVNAGFVKENTVASAKLNVRTGPGENFSIIARLEKGAPVKEIRTVGDWKEIEAPATASAYVAADLLLRQTGSSDKAVLAETKPAAPATPAPAKAKQVAKAPAKPMTPPPAPAAPVETVKVEAPPAPVTANSEVTAAKRAPKPAAAKPVEVAAAPVAPAPEPAKPIATEPVVTPVSATTTAPEEKKGFFSRVFGKSSKTNATETAKSTKEKPAKAVAKAKAATPAPVVDSEPLPIRIVTREGIVRRSFNIQTPSYFALESGDTGKIINYLYSTNTNLPWAALKDRTVTVTGQEAIDKRWPNTPVLTIETLSTLP